MEGLAMSFWSGKRVFLTGHTGFKGAWLCKLLERLGAEVTGYALAPETPSMYKISKPQAQSVIGDICDYEKLLAAYKTAAPEIVIHMAAQPLVLRGYRLPRHTFEVNVIGTVNLLECVRLCGAESVLNVTTDKVYLNREREEGYREGEELNGHDPYANSKSCSELITSCYVRSYFAGSGVPVSTARSGNVIGGGDFSENRLIPDCYRAAAKGESIVIRNPGSVRPYLHVLDTLSAYLLLARRQLEDRSLAGSYNIGPNDKESATSGELAGLFCEAWGAPASWAHVPAEAPHESGLLTLDCAKIRQKLGWKPRWDIHRAVRETAEWYRAYEAGDASAVTRRQLEAFMPEARP
jgi:CDP-glucose 4,6-dehydratase